MCGRFALVGTPGELADHFQLCQKVTFPSRYNIAPSQQVLIVRSGSEGNSVSHVRWGLIPHWAKDGKFSAKLINARAETVQEKPVFREAFKCRRCLIPATGFYEWKNEGNRKQPFFIRMNDDRLFALAGIWESWLSPDGNVIESCAIITTAANSLVAALHDRMPVILPGTDYGLWLASSNNGQSFHEYLTPYDPSRMTAYPVSGKVNYVKNEGERCIKRLAE